jgi:type II secretory pathway predicted ATPase ExeA
VKKKDKVEVVVDDKDWEVESAMETLKRYAKLVEDKKLKEKAIKELEKEADKYKKIAKDIRED